MAGSAILKSQSSPAFLKMRPPETYGKLRKPAEGSTATLPRLGGKRKMTPRKQTNTNQKAAPPPSIHQSINPLIRAGESLRPVFSSKKSLTRVSCKLKDDVRCEAQCETTILYCDYGSRRLMVRKKRPHSCSRVHHPPMKALILCLCSLLASSVLAAGQSAQLTNLSFHGGLEDGKARLVIEAMLNRLMGVAEKPIVATSLNQAIRVTPGKVTDRILASFDILNGDPSELALTIGGGGEIRKVSGKDLQDWSIRLETNGTRVLVLRLLKTGKPIRHFVVNITTEQAIESLPVSLSTLTLTPAQPALLSGYISLHAGPALEVRPENPSGLIPIEPILLPKALRANANGEGPAPLAFRFQGSPYSLPLRVGFADPDSLRLVLHDFKMIGQFEGGDAAFTLSAIASTKNPKGGSLRLLSGGAALTGLEEHPDWHVRFRNDAFMLVLNRAGDFPMQLKFNALVHQGTDHSQGWNSVDFEVAPCALEPVELRGLPADTQFEFAGAARPERTGESFVSYLPSDGSVKLSWKEARPEGEGKLFYSVEMLSQIAVSPGVMRQTALLNFKVMQGETDRVTLLVRGAGEVTRVLGDDLLAWSIEPVPNSKDRRLVVRFNQTQRDQFGLQVQVQTPLGAFPQTMQAVQLQPVAATRFSGCYRVVNEGAVKLEVTEANGLSQISPDQFPSTEATRAAFRKGGAQQFVYRFSSAGFNLAIQAEQVLPELSVSEILVYNLGENDLSIGAEIQVDIREAPLRELLLRVPKGYGIARLDAPGLADYFSREPEGQLAAELRLVYGQPVSGRQIIQLRLERNTALGQPSWALPSVTVPAAKSLRGQIGVSADEGFRLTPERTRGLTEMATAYFPRKVARLQAAFRLSDRAWQATLRVERLRQTVQADALHLFSIGEGVAYGSSVINYSISGAPVSSFKVALSPEYFNVEFTGKDIRSWQETNGTYLVQLHTPVLGAYTLLATYERPFQAQGETLTFTGARPLDVVSEQGYTLVTSTYQFRVKPVSVSSGLLAIETREVPPEYRLFFDAPLLAAYRYLARPFDLKLALSPLAQGKSLSQVVDRALLSTQVSKQGQVLTDAQYFVKNRGNPFFSVTCPQGAELWSATANGASVVPVEDAQADLIPLPQGQDPNAVVTVDLKLAQKSKQPGRVRVAAPIVRAPVLLAEWKLEPDAGQRLVYRGGSLTPASGVADTSGFAVLARTFSGGQRDAALIELFEALVALACAVGAWRWALRSGAWRFSIRHAVGTLLGLMALGLGGLALFQLGKITLAQRISPPPDISLVAPVQQPASALTVEVLNTPVGTSFWGFVGTGWPALLALAVWVWSFRIENGTARRIARVVGWVFLAWAALRFPAGAAAFLAIIAAFFVVYVASPAMLRLLQMPRRPKPKSPPPPLAGMTPAGTALLIGGLLVLNFGVRAIAANTERPGDALQQQVFTASGIPPSKEARPLAESVRNDVRIEDRFAVGTAQIAWHARKGQMLPVLFDPGVLTGIRYASNQVRLVQAPAQAKRAVQLFAEKDGAVQIEMHYQVGLSAKGIETGFVLPLQFGLVNRLDLTVSNLDVDVASPQAVLVDRRLAGSNTVATLVLVPRNGAWIAWKPRSREISREKPVFYAEIAQLYIPTAGVVEGLHQVSIRPAQGELSELDFEVPKGATVTDVTAAGGDASAADAQTSAATPQSAPVVSTWRYNPDSHRLRVSLSRPQSLPFRILIYSQVAAGGLPYEQRVGLLKVENAAGQMGQLAVATGNEVQLDTLSAPGFVPINLEDFPPELTASLQRQIPGLTVRRAFRYASVTGVADLQASAVQPDVRVESQDTISLGEDRTLFAVDATVTIARAGIFRLSWLLPPGFDVETISGPSLSHWTETKAGTNRLVTLNLKEKTMGKQSFAISLTGAGLKASKGWNVPGLLWREANKQRGTVLLAPEQGMRLQVVARTGVMQLDPRKAGIDEKGVLAFRILDTPWRLKVDIEQLAPWVQLTSLQHAAVSEAGVKVLANLQYQIENAGVKTFQVYLPTNAESVSFQSDQLADFMRAPEVTTNGLQAWEVKLERRVIGTHLIQAGYQLPLPEAAAQITLRGIQAGGVNIQRGFLTVQSGSRLQLRLDSVPAALQPAEWQSIPAVLRQDLQTAAASFAFRLIEPSFQLPLRLERHAVAKLLPARVNGITLDSVISDDGAMLTQARIVLVPGDKRLLRLTLPKGARFWYATIDQTGVWPWRDQDRILIPLKTESGGDKPISVEVFYAGEAGRGNRRKLDLKLLAPKFDLPLENIVWRVSLSRKWRIERWSGSLQLAREQTIAPARAMDIRNYLRNESSLRRQRTQKAEDLLTAGNAALQTGKPWQARRSFQAAYDLSTHDAAFNEDARVELHNVKLQQAVVGLNMRQAAVAGEAGGFATTLRGLRGGKDLNYSQQEVKDLLDRNTADENAAFTHLAERLIQQQDAAVSSPSVLHASIPQEGRTLTFKRSVLVDPWSDLKISLAASAAGGASSSLRFLILICALILFGLLAWTARLVRPGPGWEK